MTTLRTAAQQALEALETCDAAHISDGGRQWYDDKAVEEAITALKAAITEPPTDWEAVAADQAMTIALLKAEPVQEPPCATRECMPSQCPNCVSLQDQNTELDRKLAELERKPMNEFDALRLVTETVGLLQSAGPVEGLIGIIRAVEAAHGIKE